MDPEPPRKQVKIDRISSSCLEEVSSVEWEFIKMSEQEEDMIIRMYRLVGDRWDLIVGRVPGRRAEEIERFWLMRHCKVFAERRSRVFDPEKKSKVEEIVRFF